jgi:hypothetical protein
MKSEPAVDIYEDIQPWRLAIRLKLSWAFLKIKLLTSCGPASVGLLHKGAVEQ